MGVEAASSDLPLTSALQNAVQFSFVEKLWVLGTNGLLHGGVIFNLWLRATYQFDGHLLVSFDVGACQRLSPILTVVDVTKGAAAEFPRQPVFASNSEFHLYLR